MVADYLRMLHDEGKSPATVNTSAYAVKKYLKWVGNLGVTLPAFAEVELPKVSYEVKSALSSRDLALYFQLCDQKMVEPARTAALLLPCTGLRAKEMVSMQIKDIHREEVLLKSGQRKMTYTLWPQGKGDKQRIVPIFDEGVEVLIGYLAGWRRKKRGPFLFPARPLHPNNAYRHIDERTLRQGMAKVREEMGMDFTPHTMRRTYLTILWRKGVDVATIAKISGHSHVQMLVKHYLSLDSQDISGAVHDKGASWEG